MADFRPTLAPIHEKSPFRFWCQKVLPTVYDDSLSYYELLTKVVFFLNENTQDLETVNSNVEALYNSFVQLQDYVNQYFGQEFPAEIARQLDEMVENGTFTALLETIANPYFEEKTHDIDEAISNQNITIETLEGRLDNFVATHAGLSTETKINTNSVTSEDDVWIFTDDIDDYTYIDFHHTIPGNNLNPVITRVLAEDLVSTNNEQKLVFSYPPSANSSDKSLVVYMFVLGAVLDETDPLVTVALKDRVKIKKAVKWEWDGTNTPTVTHAINGTATETSCGFLVGAYGIKDEQNDTEIIDARTGYNGTVYETLGQAIRTQVSNLHSLIEYGGGGQGGIAVNINGNIYPVTSVTQGTYGGVEYWEYHIDDNTLEGINVRFYTKDGIDTIVSGIWESIPDVTENETYDCVDVTVGTDTYHLVELQKLEHDLGEYVPLSDVESYVTTNDTHPVNSVAVIRYAQKKNTQNTVSGSSVTQALNPNEFYVFGEVSSLTVTFTANNDPTVMSEYHFRFTSGATPTVLTLPSGVVFPDTLTVEANKTYEISIVDNYGVYCAW